ncbi:MAG: hypothetical protein ABI480_12005 [Chitinophagaceae bacterium]
MTKACLIIVFNHRYDKNIPVLEKIYAGRFSHIYFLVPFYNGSHPNAIPVYESSNYFQSFFAQGYARFFNEQFTHYIFLGDDCILNPAINETNVLEQTGLATGTDFIPGIFAFHEIKGEPWWHTFKGIDFFKNRRGAEIKNELPSREEAVNRFQKHGLDVKPLSKTNIFGNKKPRGEKSWRYWFFKQYHWFNWRSHKQNGKIELPYPVAGSYSDVLIITKKTVADFCRYCGIMAAAGLFVEIAIPTSLLLSSDAIAQEKDTRLKGKALWSAGEVEAVEITHHKSLSSLLTGFPPDQLFYHPIKLSKWQNDL